MTFYSTVRLADMIYSYKALNGYLMWRIDSTNLGIFGIAKLYI